MNEEIDNRSPKKVQKDMEREHKLKHHLFQIVLLNPKIEALEQQILTLRKERTSHYVEVGVLERELRIYKPDEVSFEDSLNGL